MNIFLRGFKYIKKYYKRICWRKSNSHNSTNLGLDCPKQLIKVGVKTYGCLNVHCSNDNYKLYIGNYCSIADNVIFLLSSDHSTNRVSSFPFKTKIIKSSIKEGLIKGDIVVDDDVWIGYGATIMSGVHIGQGAVIASGAVVTKDVPPYAIVGGIPAKVIKYRFSQDMINELMKIDYIKLTDEMVKEHIEDLYKELTDDAKTNVKQLEWMPRK